MAEIALRITKVVQLTPLIKMFEMVNAKGGDLPSFEPGAHLDLKLGNGLIRSYSLANDPKERHRYVTAILREAQGGGGSAWMHDTIKPGDEILSSEPLQNFPLDPAASRSLLLAGGIGITPLLSMGYRLKAEGRPVHLYYLTKSPEDTAFLDEVKAVFGEDVTFVHDGGDPSKGLDLKATFGTPEAGTHLYVCGPAGLLNAVRGVTSHWPEGSVHYELFSSARTDEQKAEMAARENLPFEVELARSGMTLEIPSDRSILDVLLDNGIGVPYACEDGWCGACVIDMISGKADHRDEVMTDEEKAENKKIQVCISRALPGEKLVLDL